MIENGQHRVTVNGSTGPGTCEVVSIEIENYLGDVKRIENIVASFKIVEMLYSPSLGLEMTIRDESNFFEEFQITGQETVRIKLRQKLFQGDREGKFTNEVNLEFYILEYSDYIKANKNQVQAYTFTGVPKHSYIAPLKKISREINSATANEIQNIMEKDLQVDKFILQGEPSSKYSGVVNWKNPLTQAMDFTKSLYDANQSPFFLFQKLNGNIYLSSISFLINEQDNPIYRIYRDSISTFADTLDTAAAELDAYTRITNLNSNIELNRVSAARDGAFSSQYQYYDLSTKTNSISNYDYVRDFKERNTLGQRLNITEDFVVPNMALEWNKIQRANLNFRPLNKFSRGGAKNRQDIIKSNSHFRKFYMQNFKACEHTIELNGDLKLNPGRTIELEITKATDPTIYKEYTGRSLGRGLDEMFSGKYLVAVCEHKFRAKGASYMTTCTVVKDSWNIREEE